ncbi:MAG: cytochrome c biogenesis CcdA family protein [Paracoccaceae bacterium]
MQPLLAYFAGLLTLINPCVLPVLPIVLASALQAGRAGPVALVAGMGVAFVAVGLLVASLGPALGLTDRTIATAGALMIGAFGLTMALPALGARFATATAGLAAGADRRMGSAPSASLGGQFAGGALLGAVWSPCIGPTLGGAIALASSGGSLIAAGVTMTAFAAGVATVMLAIAFGARAALARNRARMQALATGARPILGWAFVAVALLILSGGVRMIESAAVRILPYWLQDLSVSI